MQQSPHGLVVFTYPRKGKCAKFCGSSAQVSKSVGIIWLEQPLTPKMNMSVSLGAQGKPGLAEHRGISENVRTVATSQATWSEQSASFFGCQELPREIVLCPAALGCYRSRLWPPGLGHGSLCFPLAGWPEFWGTPPSRMHLGRPSCFARKRPELRGLQLARQVLPHARCEASRLGVHSSFVFVSFE